MNLVKATFLLVASLAILAVSADHHSEDSRDLQARIVGGSEAPVDRYPYTVSLQDDGFHFCGGSLIAPDIVLCAAHCQPGAGEKVVVNPYNINSNIASAETFNIVADETVFHPQYSGQTLDNDFVIIKLSGLSSNPVVRLNDDPTQPSDNSQLDVMGWGVFGSGSNSSPDKLHEVDVVAMTNAECNGQYSGITNNMLCALEDSKGSCQGDSGGPLIIRGNNAQGSEDVQVGVVSWGVGCADRNNPGVYARVSSKYQWIKTQVCDLSDNAPASFACPDGPNPPPPPAPISDPTPAPVPDLTPEPPGPDGVEMTKIFVEIELDDYPWETSWIIKDTGANGGSVWSLVPAFSDSTSGSVQIVSVTLPLDGSYKLILKDSYADGFNGRLRVFLGDGLDQNKILANFDGAQSPFTNRKRINFEAGTNGILPPPPPPGAMVNVNIAITLDDYPGETSWVIKDVATNSVVPGARGGTYNANQAWETIEAYVSLHKGHEYKFILKDSYGDGLYGTVDLYQDDGSVIGQFDGFTDYSSFGWKQIKFTTF